MHDDEIREISQTMANLGTVNATVIERLFVEFADQISSTGTLTGTYESTERLLSKVLDRGKVVQDGNAIGIFPEGRLTVTGTLMKVYDGAAMVADKTGSMVVPIRIDGLEHSYFTYLN